MRGPLGFAVLLQPRQKALPVPRPGQVHLLFLGDKHLRFLAQLQYPSKQALTDWRQMAPQQALPCSSQQPLLSTSPRPWQHPMALREEAMPKKRRQHLRKHQSSGLTSLFGHSGAVVACPRPSRAIPQPGTDLARGCLAWPFWLRGHRICVNTDGIRGWTWFPLSGSTPNLSPLAPFMSVNREQLQAGTDWAGRGICCDSNP